MRVSVIANDAPHGATVDIEYEARIDPVLQACPFCGVVPTEVIHTWTPAYWVQCENCDAQAGSFYVEPRNDSVDALTAAHRVSFSKAITKWNCRALDKFGVKVDLPRPDFSSGQGDFEQDQLSFVNDRCCPA